ncbi:MAG: MBL fold metallo-hydrolase [Ruminococcus sp.]|jgi:glyoxylase-like metal-dependent hydrolase (beta-lactamase superfamily II)|nr:MBL fold metallo-hydrolase [Ruminococcus sp.]
MSYTTIKLADDLWAIEEGFVRAFLLHGGKGSLLIDACMSGGDELRETVLSITGGVRPTMTVTHTDGDHIGGFNENDTVFIHPTEFYHLGDHRFNVLSLWETDSFQAGNRNLRVRLIPGHTPGSIALIDYEAKMIFIGDSVSDSHVFMFGNGRNIDAYIESLTMLKTEFGGYGFYACHGTTVLPPSALDKQLECALKVRTGEITGEEAPHMKGCKLYSYNGAALLY